QVSTPTTRGGGTQAHAKPPATAEPTVAPPRHRGPSAMPDVLAIFDECGSSPSSRNGPPTPCETGACVVPTLTGRAVQSLCRDSLFGLRSPSHGHIGHYSVATTNRRDACAYSV